LQDLLGEEDEEPRPLFATGFDSIAARILRSARELEPERQAEERPERGVPAGAPDAVAALLRAIADLLDGGGER